MGLKLLMITTAFMHGQMQYPEIWIMRMASFQGCATMQHFDGEGPAGWIKTRCYLIRANGEVQELPYEETP